jgi:intraflagellar transport protein 81
MASPLEGLKKVVDILNQEPFSLGLTLVTLDSKDAPGLIGVLNKGEWGKFHFFLFSVLAYIDQSTLHPPAEPEPLEVLSHRLVSCLKMLNHRPAQGYTEAWVKDLVQGQKGVVYPVLYWLLANREALRRRAGLAKFLVPVEVPAHLLNNTLDSQFELTYKRYTELQGVFRTTHQLLEQVNLLHSFRVYFFIFFTRFECIFSSSSLVLSVFFHLLHSFRV